MTEGVGGRSGESTREEKNRLDAQFDALAIDNFLRALEDSGAPPQQIFTRGARVIEFGAGEGGFAARLRMHFPGLDYTTIDENAEASEKARKANPDATVVNAEISEFLRSVPDGSLDCVIAMNACNQLKVKELASVLARFQSKLRPGGIFVGGIDLNQSNTLVMSYLREYGSFPVDGRHPKKAPAAIRKQPFSVLLNKPNDGIYTYSVYLDGRGKVERLKRRISQQLAKDGHGGSVTAAGPTDEVAFSPSDARESARIIEEEARLSRIDHNAGTNEITKALAQEAGFSQVKAKTITARKILPRGDGVNHHEIKVNSLISGDKESSNDEPSWQTERAEAQKSVQLPPASAMPVYLCSFKGMYVVARK